MELVRLGDKEFEMDLAGKTVRDACFELLVKHPLTYKHLPVIKGLPAKRDDTVEKDTTLEFIESVDPVQLRNTVYFPAREADMCILDQAAKFIRAILLEHLWGERNPKNPPVAMFRITRNAAIVNALTGKLLDLTEHGERLERGGMAWHKDKMLTVQFINHQRLYSLKAVDFEIILEV